MCTLWIELLVSFFPVVIWQKISKILEIQHTYLKYYLGIYKFSTKLKEQRTSSECRWSKSWLTWANPLLSRRVTLGGVGGLQGLPRRPHCRRCRGCRRRWRRGRRGCHCRHPGRCHCRLESGGSNQNPRQKHQRHHRHPKMKMTF